VRKREKGNVQFSNPAYIRNSSHLSHILVGGATSLTNI
jgi:hypothetical protein